MTRLLQTLLGRVQKWFGGVGASFPTSNPTAPPVSIPAAPSAPDWLPEHQAAWLAFLRTNAGATVMARCRAISCQVASSACKDVFHTQHSAGIAAGWEECRTWLESLSRASRAPDDANDIPGAAQDEPSLSEILSP